MEVTCGVYLYSSKRKKILACHATRTPKNNWSIPKGLPDAGEDYEVAALRELNEETGIELQTKNPEAYALPLVKYQKRNKWLAGFLIITLNDFADHTFVCHSWVEKKFPEVDKWEWITLDEAETKLHESQRKNIHLIRDILEKNAP